MTRTLTASFSIVLLAGCSVEFGRDPATRKVLYSSDDPKKKDAPEEKKPDRPLEKGSAGATTQPAGGGKETGPQTLGRNWAVSEEAPEVDFSRGGPQEWYPALYGYVREQSRIALSRREEKPLMDHLEAVHARTAKALANMGRLLAAGQADSFKKLAAEYDALKDSLLNPRIDRSLARAELQAFDAKLAREFPPEKAALRPASDFVVAK